MAEPPSYSHCSTNGIFHPMKLLPLLISSAAILLCACDTKPKVTSVSADELLAAVGGHVFVVRFPDSTGARDQAELVLRLPNDIVLPVCTGIGVKPNQELRMIVLFPEQGMLRYTIFMDGIVLRGERKDLPAFNASGTNDTKSFLQANQPLMRFGSQGKIGNLGDPLEDGQFDLIFQIRSESGEPGQRKP